MHNSEGWAVARHSYSRMGVQPSTSLGYVDRAKALRSDMGCVFERGRILSHEDTLLWIRQKIIYAPFSALSEMACKNTRYRGLLAAEYSVSGLPTVFTASPGK